MAKSRHILTILFSFFLVGFLFLSQATPAHAGLLDLIGSKAKNATQKATEKAVDAALEAEKGNSSIDSTTQNVGGGMSVFLFLSTAGANDKTLSAVYFDSLTPDEKQVLADKYGNGAIGDVGNWVAALYNPPASSQTYLADVLDNMHIVPKAQAQGLGFASLDPILETWKVFRNIAYLFFVIIFLVIGFMIMFRHKIKGQAVVTAQQAIPSIIIALIMVTFSYAIAGLMIDGMYVLMYLIIGLFGANTQLVDMNIFEIGFKFITSGAGSAFSTVNDTIQSIVDFGFISDVFAWVSGLTVALIIAVAILIGVFKLFFELLKTYINIILSITFAPLILMFGALPGQNTFGKWLTSLVGNLLVFPAVLLVLIMHQMMKGSGVTTGGFMPPYILGRGVGDVINTVVGLGLILILPELVQKLKKMMGADGGVFAEFGAAAWKNFQKGVGPGTALLAGGTAIGTGVAGGVGGGLYGAYKAQQEGGTSEEIWQAAKRQAARGALLGGAAPMVLRAAPPFIKGAAKDILREGRQMVTTEMMGEQWEKIKAYRGQQHAESELEMAKAGVKAAKSQTRSTKDRTRYDDSGDGGI